MKFPAHPQESLDFPDSHQDILVIMDTETGAK